MSIQHTGCIAPKPCPICANWHTYPPHVRANLATRTATATPKAIPLPCVHEGEPLTGFERNARGLDSRAWKHCNHPKQPLGDVVCGCKGCGPSCPGYPKTLDVSFKHGIGDATNFAHMIPLYRARGYTVRVNPGHADHAPVFRAAGAEIVDSGTHHAWREGGSENKNRANLAAPGLPDLRDAWDEYAAVRIDFAAQVTDADRRWADDALKYAQPPIVALHVKGFPWTNGRGVNREYPPDATAELQRILVTRTGGTVIVLDRDGSTPRSNLPGVIHVRDYSPGMLYALLARCNALAGIDSGPLHFARFLPNLPTIGIWTNHYPADYALPPRANTVHVVADRHAARDAKDGAAWNTRLAPDDGPSPQFVADTICERLPTPRANLLPPRPKLEPLPLPPRHPAAIFPDAISSTARRIREAAESSPYDHRPFLHPGDTDFADKLSEQFRRGYACVKWGVAKVIQPRAILEIGVGGGLAALAMLDAAPDAAYVGVDIGRYDDQQGVPLLGHVEEQFAALGRKGRILRMDSKTLKELPGEFDLVHVDGDHAYEACRSDVAIALASGAPWILVDDARDNQVCAATFAALLAWRPGSTEWAFFEDSWTGSILIYTGKGAR